MIDPLEETDDMCDYERQRMQNIKDIYLSYGDLMVGVKVSTEDLLKSVSSSKTKEASVNGRKRRRSCSQNWQRVKKCTTLDDNGNPPACIKRSARLRNVKRQKTTDQKSYCRYKGCIGVCGMFCGFCLGKRYGEDVAEVLLNPKWACPVCRGYCNCSICRRKNGKEPTGQLAQRAEAGGFKSVRHLLNKIEGEDTEKFSDGEYEHDGNNLENIVVEQENCISEVNNSELDDVKIENDVINYQPKKESQNCKDANDEVKNLCFADTKAENNIAEDLSGSNKPVLNVSNCSNSDEQHISDIIIDVNKDTSEMIIDKLYQKLFTNSQSTHIY